MARGQVREALREHGELRLPELIEIADSSPLEVFLATRELYHDEIIDRTGPGTYARGTLKTEAVDDTGFHWSTTLED